MLSDWAPRATGKLTSCSYGLLVNFCIWHWQLPTGWLGFMSNLHPTPRSAPCLFLSSISIIKSCKDYVNKKHIFILSARIARCSQVSTPPSFTHFTVLLDDCPECWLNVRTHQANSRRWASEGVQHVESVLAICETKCFDWLSQSARIKTEMTKLSKWFKSSRNTKKRS